MILTNYINFHFANCFYKRNEINNSNQALICTSRNLLRSEVFKENPKLHPTNHCLSMSLHFIKRYKEKNDIQFTANSMKDGADNECAKTSLLYDQIFKENPENARLEIEKKFLNSVNEFTLHSPIKEALKYIKNELPSGEFLIPLYNHVICLIKSADGRIFVFDPNYGTVDISLEDGKKWFIKLLKKNRVNLKETLTFISNVVFKEKEVDFPEDPMELAFEKKANAKWGKAYFNWRGDEYVFTWDSEKNVIYNYDSKNLIRYKCVALIFRTSIAKSIRIVYKLARAVFFLIGTFFTIFNKSMRSICKQKFFESLGEIISLPFYTLALLTTALYGILKPYEGRRLFGMIERSLNNESGQVHIKRIRYSAPCFTPVSMNDIHKIQMQDIKKILLRDIYFEEKINELCRL